MVDGHVTPLIQGKNRGVLLKTLPVGQTLKSCSRGKNPKSPIFLNIGFSGQKIEIGTKNQPLTKNQPFSTPYYNGIYHGMLKFPKEYPFQPPSILMFTPNGRFLTNKRLCLSMSDYHPEKWNPAWGVGTILVGLLSFMNSDESEGIALGMLKTSDACKEKLAEESFDFNRNTDRGHGAIFSELFTIFMWEEEERRQHRMKRRKLEESNENVKNLIENSENSENGESFSESKISDSSSQGRNFGKIPAEVLRSSRGKRANFFQKWFQPRQTWRCWPFPAEAREAKEALNYAPAVE